MGGIALSMAKPIAAGIGDVATLATERAKSEAKTAASDYFARQSLIGTGVGTGVGLYMASGGFSGKS